MGSARTMPLNFFASAGRRHQDTRRVWLSLRGAGNEVLLHDVFEMREVLVYRKTLQRRKHYTGAGHFLKCRYGRYYRSCRDDCAASRRAVTIVRYLMADNHIRSVALRKKSGERTIGPVCDRARSIDRISSAGFARSQTAPTVDISIHPRTRYDVGFHK